ncbi:hypothetical protein Ndes2437B_g05176 [Nannochloris sp. 'desiccata']
MTERRRDPRSFIGNYQERRRLAALERQQSARSKAIDSRRRLDDLSLITDLPLREEEEDIEGRLATVAASSEDLQDHSDIQMSPSSSSSLKAQDSPTAGQYLGQQQRKELWHHWASQLMNPEWLIEIPTDLATEWYVLPRPEGQRCTVLASKGRTISRLRNGILFENFQSGLPYGSRETYGEGGGQSNYSLLDCIYHAATETYYIIDMMIWRGRELYDCTTEFRFFWMHSKLEEEPANLLATTHRKQCVPLPAYPATPSGIQAAYSDPVTFTRDGLYFIHRRTQYSPGQTPLALTWKDAASSRFFIDTDAKGVVHPEQQVVLQYAHVPSRGVCTGDEPAIPLGTMPEQFVEKVGAKLKPGRLLKFTLGSGGVEFSSPIKIDNTEQQQQQQQQEMHPVGADLKFIGVANQRRGRADTLSKILFQMMARRQPIRIDMLKTAASDSESRGLVGVEGQEGESIGIVGRDNLNADDNRMND